MSTKIVINCETELKQLDGNTLKGNDGVVFTVGKVLSVIVLNFKGKEFNHFKKWELAKEFFNSKEISLDKADFAIIKNMVSEDNSYPSLILGQIENILINLG